MHHDCMLVVPQSFRKSSWALPLAAHCCPVRTGLRFLNGSVGQDSGGCILISGGSPTIDSCQFEGCRADLGGAINVAALRSTATLVGSRFTGCSARRGGGVRVATGAAVTVSSCTFEGNAADDAVGVGGAMVFDGSAPSSIRDTNMTGGRLGHAQGNLLCSSLCGPGQPGVACRSVAEGSHA